MISSTQTNSPFVDGKASAREAVIARLRSAGLRITQPRLALVSVLLESERPATIEQLFERAGSMAGDLVTFYRCVAAFEKAGVVFRTGFGERGASLYAMVGDSQRRYPLVRKGTSNIEHLDEELCSELHAAIERVQSKLRERGYGTVQHIVEFFAEPREA
jgi:Fe2+ or Zn2+ uptake regulation protein